MKPLLRTADVAELLSVSPETVLRRWRTGDLPGYRLSTNALRFDPDAIAQWLASKAHNEGAEQ